jgi:hypothetical protein
MVIYFLVRRSRAKSLAANTIETPHKEDKEDKEDEHTEFLIVPINATDATNSQIEDGLNNLGTMIKSIANAASKSTPAGSSYGSDAVASFIDSVQIEQGGSKQSLPPKKIEATQALQAAIAMRLFNRLLLPGNLPQHPLFPSAESNSARFNQWLGTQAGFEGRKRLTNDRKRQWIAKYLAENIKAQQFRQQHQDLVDKTTKDIEGTIGQLYPNWDVSLRERIKPLVESALDLTVKMMGKRLAISPHWMLPGQAFSEYDMKMTDILKSGGVVALCVFPAWKDSEDHTIAKAKVYCL